MSIGRSFQAEGAANAKVLSPKPFKRDEGTHSKRLSDNRRTRPGE